MKNNEEKDIKTKPLSIRPLEAFRKSRKIIELSLEARQKTQEIFSQLDLFIATLKNFIIDKDFKIESGRLIISNKYGVIEHQKLSSGEKQLIILIIEALLQKQEEHIYLADEPELSLHISWQRNIIPAVKNINPNAQIIVATHAPEVAAKYKDSIIDMESMING
nr:AAA family ATPase [Shewanella fodinae]